MEIDIKKEYKTPSGVYILCGEEDYLKRFYAAGMREALLGDSPYALFNHVIFTPKSFTADAASDALMTPPVFDEKKLIELSEFNFTELKAAEMIVVEGTLYPLLTRLKNDDLLSYEWIESTQGPPRKYYRLTAKGEAFLGELEVSWRELSDTVNHIANN